MSLWTRVLLAAFLCVAPVVAAQQMPSQKRMPHPQEPATTMALGHMIVFEHEGLVGNHTHFFGNTPDLGSWGNSISSVVILSGRWAFYDSTGFQGTRMQTLGPGVYLAVREHGITDNRTASLKLVTPGPRT